VDLAVANRDSNHVSILINDCAVSKSLTEAELEGLSARTLAGTSSASVRY
jgi:hypothetical protein